jgi:uncharacterized protein YjbJ (UPF0337 family)
MNTQVKMDTQVKTTEPFKITGDWAALSKRLKAKFSKLTDADLKFETGKEDDLLSQVQTRLNKGRQEVINIIRKSEPQTL